MNDLKTLAEFGRELDPPSALPPADLRRRVMTATARRPRFALPRLGIRLAAGGALAAVVTGAVLAGQVIGVGHHAPASSAQASALLRDAAAQAKRQPAVAVRGDQFIYAESIETSVGFDLSGTNPPTFESRQSRTWDSVDGVHDGLSSSRPRDGSVGWSKNPIPGCRNGVKKARKGDRFVRVACQPEPVYAGDFPADPGAMLTYLRGRGGTKNGPDQDAFSAAAELIREPLLPPAVLAAVFEAVARIPGVSVAGTATDEAGRSGLAVTRDEVQGSRVELIFDPKTYAYLGERTVLLTDQDGLRAGRVLDSIAVLRVAVVSAAGRLP